MTTEFVHKVTLPSSKVVLLRDLKIKHQQLAARAVGSRFSDAPLAQNLALQDELLKILIVSVNGKEFRSHEELDDHLTMAEYNQLQKVLGQLIGGGDSKAPLVEVMSSSGDK